MGKKALKIQAQLNSEDGFTLVELLISVVILIFVSIALMQTALVNIEFNTRNALRDEATRVAVEALDNARNIKYIDVTKSPGPYIANGTVHRQVRNIDVTYGISNTASNLDKYGIRMSTTVSWQWKQETFSTTMNSIR